MTRTQRVLAAVVIALLPAVPGCFSFHDLLPWNWSFSDEMVPKKDSGRNSKERSPTDPKASRPPQQAGTQQTR